MSVIAIAAGLYGLCINHVLTGKFVVRLSLSKPLLLPFDTLRVTKFPGVRLSLSKPYFLPFDTLRVTKCPRCRAERVEALLLLFDTLRVTKCPRCQAEPVEASTFALRHAQGDKVPQVSG